ncbi:MAG: glycosyltransferase family 4 protein [Thermoleophilia bacterium]
MPVTTSSEACELAVVIAGTKFAYPEGSGAASRTHAYARGLMEDGVPVKVVSLLTPSTSATSEERVRGVHEGVPFEYACGTRRRQSTFWRRRLVDARVPLGLWRTASRHFADAPGARAIIAYSDQPLWITTTALIAKALHATCVVEVCEVPLISEHNPLRLALRSWLLDAVAYRSVDGFIVISAFLADHIRSRAPRRTRMIRVPILVAPEDFAAVATPTSATQRIVFAGSLDNAGEIPDLLAAFSLVADDNPQARLVLAGGAATGVVDALGAEIVRRKLEQRVEFAGWTPRDELPALFASAAVLVLPRRDGLFSKAGFPTKLGEYLASGRPVVATATGEIASHLRDGVDAYLVPPGDPTAFAARLRHVLANPGEAQEVGTRGRELATSTFDRRRHGRRLHRFLCDLAMSPTPSRLPEHGA